MRQLRPLTPEQRRAEADLAIQLQRVDERVARLTTRAKHTPEETKQLDELRNQQNLLRGQWVEFQNEMDRQYQAYTGKPSAPEEIQRTLPDDGALVGWLDVKNYHWACVVRKTGEPAWVKISGSGEKDVPGVRRMTSRDRDCARRGGQPVKLASAGRASGETAAGAARSSSQGDQAPDPNLRGPGRDSHRVLVEAGAGGWAGLGAVS